jgi:uncharacterized protein (TIGR02246 family)
MRRVALLAAICLTMPSLAFAQDAKNAIQKYNDEMAAAINRGDPKSGVGFYADDATILPPGSQMIKGKSEILNFWAKTGKGLSDAKIAIVDVKPLGPDTAREIGTFSFKNADHKEVTGKYVVVWQKIGNEWKNTTDIWNTN